MKNNLSLAPQAHRVADLPDLRFIGTGSPMRDMVRTHDWASTPLGDIASWPVSLRTAVGIVMNSPFPMFLWWGEDMVQIYNDGYRVVCGDKHPTAMGMDYTECWASAWPVIGEPFEQARKGKRQRRARRHVEEMARRPEEHKWQWVSNEETGDPGCKTWHVTPRYGPVGALMGWWRVKVSSGCP